MARFMMKKLVTLWSCLPRTTATQTTRLPAMPHAKISAYRMQNNTFIEVCRRLIDSYIQGDSSEW